MLIRWAGESAKDEAQAQRLLDRARRRAGEGEHERVAALCRQALRLQPSLHAARRELAHAHLETGDRGAATVALWHPSGSKRRNRVKLKIVPKIPAPRS